MRIDFNTGLVIFLFYLLLFYQKHSITWLIQNRSKKILTKIVKDNCMATIELLR